jgi:hypothetical protein
MYQVIEQTPEDKFDMYMEMPKESLVLMLISCNRICGKLISRYGVRYDPAVFIPPFRVGRKQKRAVLDAKGREVILMPPNSGVQAQMYADYLNGF